MHFWLEVRNALVFARVGESHPVFVARMNETRSAPVTDELNMGCGGQSQNLAFCIPAGSPLLGGRRLDYPY